MEPLVSLHKWPPIREPSALSPTASTCVSPGLLSAHSPLIITSFLGRNPHSVAVLTALYSLLIVLVYVACPSAVNISHPYYDRPSFLPFWRVDAELVCNAHSELALSHIVEVTRQIDEQASTVWEAVLGSQVR